VYASAALRKELVLGLLTNSPINIVRHKFE